MIINFMMIIKVYNKMSLNQFKIIFNHKDVKKLELIELNQIQNFSQLKKILKKSFIIK